MQTTTTTTTTKMEVKKEEDDEEEKIKLQNYTFYDYVLMLWVATMKIPPSAPKDYYCQFETWLSSVYEETITKEDAAYINTQFIKTQSPTFDIIPMALTINFRAHDAFTIVTIPPK